MSILQIAMLIFIILEVLNVTTLYFNSGSKIGNGIGVFNAWERSKEDEEMHNFVKYLVYWVAGTKLIFIVLIIVIIITGSPITQLMATIVLIASIFSFYWRLYPIMKSMDLKGQISPKGYSKSLNYMIAGFIGIFVIALALHFLL